MKTRLLGAAVLMALAVLFVPMFFSGNSPSRSKEQTLSLEIPPAPDQELQTRTMNLLPEVPAVAPKSTAESTPTKTPGPSDALSHPSITPGASAAQGKRTTVTSHDSHAHLGQVKPGGQLQTKQQPLAAIKQMPTRAKVRTANAAATEAVAAYTSFNLNLGAYAAAHSAQSVIRRARALGYPVDGRTIKQGGHALTLVSAGPFASRTAAEAARLKIIQAMPGVPVRLGKVVRDQQGDAPALDVSQTSANTAKAGAWAIQLAALANRADADALRDKLQAGGFDAFVDTVETGSKRLWRVRIGPQIQREDARRLRDQIKTKLGIRGNIVSMP